MHYIRKLWDCSTEWHTLSCLVIGTLLLTTFPLTLTLPCKMRSSAPRREATPAVASTCKWTDWVAVWHTLGVHSPRKQLEHDLAEPLCVRGTFLVLATLLFVCWTS